MCKEKKSKVIVFHSDVNVGTLEVLAALVEVGKHSEDGIHFSEITTSDVAQCIFDSIHIQQCIVNSADDLESTLYSTTVSDVLEYTHSKIIASELGDSVKGEMFETLTWINEGLVELGVVDAVVLVVQIGAFNQVSMLCPVAVANDLY